MNQIITDEAVISRKRWIEKIASYNKNFIEDFKDLEKRIGNEFKEQGVVSLIDHLRLCGNIPECYEHDSSEEKMYSKYTDCLLCYAFKQIGLKSIVIEERADVADVEVVSNSYDFVADAKAFRLSRTAKNQKDFKVQAMDRWKHGKKYAMVVCPIYQLPKSSSQIYEQASSRNVCIFTYSHLSLIVQFAEIFGRRSADELLCSIFRAVEIMNPSKSAFDYWQTINKTIIEADITVSNLWKTEKIASLESISIAKQEGIEFLSKERAKILRMDHDEALMELIRINRIESRIQTIESISDNGLFDVK